MLKAIIFDLDGVIIDSHPIHKKAWRRFFSSIGREVSDTELNFVLEGRKRDVILRYFLGELTDEQTKSYGRMKEALFREESSAMQVVEGLPGFLDDLEANGIAMGVGTSGGRTRVRYVLERLGLRHHFKAIITGDDVVSGKPDPSVFLEAAKCLNVPPPEVLVFEDAVSGVQAAKSAGMKCVGIAANGRAQSLLDAGADDVLPNFAGAYLQQLQLLFR
jgi:beta-phosphoglucomutase